MVLHISYYIVKPQAENSEKTRILVGYIGSGKPVAVWHWQTLHNLKIIIDSECHPPFTLSSLITTGRKFKEASTVLLETGGFQNTTPKIVELEITPSDSF